MTSMIPMTDIETQVVQRDGKAHAVTAVYHRGEQPTFRFTFSDATSIVCDDLTKYRPLGVGAALPVRGSGGASAFAVSRVRVILQRSPPPAPIWLIGIAAPAVAPRLRNSSSKSCGRTSELKNSSGGSAQALPWP